MSVDPFRPPGAPQRGDGSRNRWPLLLFFLLLAAGAGWWIWTIQDRAPSGHELATSSSGVPAVGADVQPLPGDTAATTEMPTAPIELVHPIEVSADIQEMPPLDQADASVGPALDAAFGATRVASFFQVDGFIRRVVATVDNLTRAHAASRIWPIQPISGRFMVSGKSDAPYIADDNSARYTSLILLAEQADLKRLAGTYRKLYPLFQQAYEELGYPSRYFNDRLVAVIDHLLAAPEPQGPVALHLTEVKGETVSLRPWVRYEYADPALESLSAGQKMMVRVGLANERKLKQRLRDFRALVV